MTLDGYHYQILRVPVDRQSKICAELKLRFPEDHVRVFLPMWEYYRRDRKSVETKLMFTGYIFLWTDLKRSMLYETCKSLAKPVRAHLEKSAEIWSAGEDYVFDLTEEEEVFFNNILDDQGVERMSLGYIDEASGKAVVMEGPLVKYGNRICKLDKHNWLAWLDIKVGENPVMAGLRIDDRETWFPAG